MNLEIIKAVRLNEEAVFCLRKRNYIEALAKLKDAAEIMYATTKSMSEGARRGMPLSEKIDLPAVASDKDEPLDDDAQHPRRKRSLCNLGTAIVKSGHLLHESERGSFAEDEPLQLLVLALPFEEEAACSTVSTVILYNMALAYHVSIIRCFPLKESKHNALALYENATNLAMINTSKDKMMIYIITSSQNNRGCIFLKRANSTLHNIFLMDWLLSWRRWGCHSPQLNRFTGTRFS